MKTISSIIRKFILSILFTFLINTVYCQIQKNNYPSRFISNLDSINYTKDSIIYYCSYEGNVYNPPPYVFYPLCEADIYKVRNKTKVYFFNRKLFDPKDSVLLHGELRIRDYNKPYESIRAEFDAVPIETDCISMYSYSPYMAKLSTAIGNCRMGLKEGKWVVYPHAIKFARIEEHYKKGLRDGLYTVFAKDSSILYQTTFNKGAGLEKIFTDEGNLYEEKWFENDSVDYFRKQVYYYPDIDRPMMIVDPENHIEELYRKDNFPLYKRIFNKTITNNLSKPEEHEFRFKYRRDGTFEQIEHLTDSVVNYTIYGTKCGGVKKIRPWSLKNTLQYYRFKKLSKMGTQELNAMEEKYYRLGE